MVEREAGVRRGAIEMGFRDGSEEGEMDFEHGKMAVNVIVQALKQHAGTNHRLRNTYNQNSPKQKTQPSNNPTYLSSNPKV